MALLLVISICLLVRKKAAQSDKYLLIWGYSAESGQRVSLMNWRYLYDAYAVSLRAARQEGQFQAQPKNRALPRRGFLR